MHAVAIATLFAVLGYSTHPIAQAIDKQYLTTDPCKEGVYMPAAGLPASWYEVEFPLALLIHEELPEDVKDAIIIAAAKWNRHLGFEAFTAYTISEAEYQMLPYVKGQIRINFSEVPMAIEHLAETVHAWTLFEYRGVLRIDLSLLHYVMEHSNWYETMLHELGHALGLGHDNEDKESIMFPRNVKNRQFIRSNDVKYIQDARFKRPVCKTN